MYDVEAHNISVMFNQTTGDVLIGTEGQKQAIKTAQPPAYGLIAIAIVITIIVAILISFALLHKTDKKRAHKEHKVRR